MKASELMLGNWVTMNGIPIQVTRLSTHGEYQNVEPIPLTPEILKKNGFVQDDKLWWHLKNEDRKTLFMMDSHFSFSVSLKVVRIWYVHQLQNTLHICELEKEIVL